VSPIIIYNVTNLYNAVNNPANAGRILILRPGIYPLDHRGRLDFQRDMSIVGVAGYPNMVIIDASLIPASAYQWTPQLRTGAIRMGLGDNYLESVTIQNTLGNTNNIRSLIETDLIGTPTAYVNISNSVLRGASIGLAISNRQTLSNSRVLKVDLYRNEISNNLIGNFKVAIQVQNSHQVTDGSIAIKMSRNFLHHNETGLRAFSAASANNIIINSRQDRISQNRLGLSLMGGFIGTGNQSNDNKTIFEANNDIVIDNTAVQTADDDFTVGGVFGAAGAIAVDNVPGVVNNNTLDIKIHHSIIAHNVSGDQMNIFGGYTRKPASSPVGNYNVTTLHLTNNTLPQYHIADSSPIDPSGTNKVKVV
jgi:hypothetical protein